MASEKSALGKGLSALLPSQDDEERSGTDEAEGSGRNAFAKSKMYRFEDRERLAGRVAEVAVTAIRPNPYQPRRDFSDAALDELAASIKQLGIIQPVTVRALGDGQFEIISGERRLRAARRAGLKRIPAFVREADSEEMLEMAIVENVQREELNPVEIALGYQRLIDECDLTQAEVAERVGKNRATVSNFLRLLRLPPRAQAALRDGRVSVGHARALITIDDEQDKLDVLEQILTKDLSVRQVEARVRRLREPEPAPADEDTTTDEEHSTQPSADALQRKALTDKLRARFSTQVALRQKKDGSGTIEIAYYSDEDLERILELLLP